MPDTSNKIKCPCPCWHIQIAAFPKAKIFSLISEDKENQQIFTFQTLLSTTYVNLLSFELEVCEQEQQLCLFFLYHINRAAPTFGNLGAVR